MLRNLRTILWTLLCAGLLNLGSAQDTPELLFPTGEDSRFHWENLAAFEALDLRGETITIFGPWLGAQAQELERVLEYFARATGAEVVYTGSDAFEQQVQRDIQGNTPPNIAVFPQPGLAADLAVQGLLVPLGEAFAQWTLETYAAGSSWVELGSYAGSEGVRAYYSFPFKVNVKSLVWYVPERFAAAGYRVPASMEDLFTLSEQIVADGGVPWCIGLAAGEASGWPATDWVEDILLRTQPPEVYDAWVSNAVRFDDPRVVEAVERFGAIAKTDAWVSGGAQGTVMSDYRDAPAGLFNEPPSCYMHHQASFIPAFFPERVQLGKDVDFFYLPPFAGSDAKPVLGAGTLWSIAADSEGTRALLEFLKTPLAHELWMAQSGFLTPHTGVNTDLYADDTLRKQGDILLSATTFRFDGSDLMPSAIGAGAFWRVMTAYVTDPDMSAADAAAAVQAEWNALKAGQRSGD